MLQLFYVSDNVAGSDARALDDIMVQAQTNNAIDGITGLLWTDGKRFAQVLEGGEAAVSALTVKLLADPRHSNLQILDRVSIDRRHFGDWAMVQPAAEPLAELYEERVKRFLSRIVGPVNDAFQQVIATSRLV